MAGEEEKTSQTKTLEILEKIKREIMLRKQLAAQNNTIKSLEKVNKSVENLGNKIVQKSKPIDIRMPSVKEIIEGFARVSPIFNRDYSVWMKDTLDVGQDTNQELVRIGSKIEKLGLPAPKEDNKPEDTTEVEYLDLISDQLKNNGEKTLTRLDDHGNKLDLIAVRTDMVRESIDKMQSDSLTRIVTEGHKQQGLLYRIDETIRKTASHIVGSLVRMQDKQERWREEDNLRRAEEDKEIGGNPRADVVPPGPTPGEEDNASGSGIAAALATWLGLGFLKKLFAPIKWVLAGIGGFLGMFSKLGEGITKLLGPFGKVIKFLKVGPLVLLSSIFEFGKGFINAKDILGKAQVTIVERVQAGLSELVGSFGDLFDWVAKVFGFDTQAGKSIREFMIAITQKPVEWLNSIVSWFKDDLFAGIGKSTALVDIPGKIVDNLQKELIKLVDWVMEGVTEVIDEGIAVAGKVIDNIKSGFNEHVKKPFFNMLNAITDGMFDLVDKFVSLIPDSLGGETARRKMEEARQAMKIESDDDKTVASNDQGQTAPQTQNGATPNPAPAVEAKPDAKSQPVEPAPVSPSLTPVATSKAPKQDEQVDRVAEMMANYQSQVIAAAKPTQGRAMNNIDQLKATYGQQQPTVIAPVTQNNVNAPQQNVTNNNYHSQSLEPGNRSDKVRLNWEW